MNGLRSMMSNGYWRSLSGKKIVVASASTLSLSATTRAMIMLLLLMSPSATRSWTLHLKVFAISCSPARRNNGTSGSGHTKGKRWQQKCLPLCTMLPWMPLCHIIGISTYLISIITIIHGKHIMLLLRIQAIAFRFMSPMNTLL